jgi:nucleotide-binding universal stress UspA family protein
MKDMKPFSRILVPVDFLPHSAEAVRRALDVASQPSAQVVLLHVYEPARYPAAPGDVVYDADQFVRMTIGIRARLEATRREVDPMGHHHITTVVLQGTPVDSIVELAARERFDLIVMGTHGRTGVGRVVLGSIAEKVMRRAPCAVLTVKSARTTDIERRGAEPLAALRWTLPTLPFIGRRRPQPAALAERAEPVETLLDARHHLPPSV